MKTATLLKSLFLPLVCLLIVQPVLAQEFLDLEGDYLGQTPPDSVPQIFAPDIVSIMGRYEYGLAIAPDHQEIFFSAEGPGPGLMVTRRVDDRWTVPVAAGLVDDSNWSFEAFYTDEGQKLYFSYIAKGEQMPEIWLAEKSEGGYQAPYKLESPVNDAAVMWAAFSSDGTMYYTNLGVRKMYYSELLDEGYTEVAPVGIEFGSHPFPAPDESFLLFNGKGSIWVSFRSDDAGWTEPISLGGLVNSEYSETCPSLSPDGKYLFFSRYNEPEDKANIYWVSSQIIERLRPSD